ncbi:hypothetical protein [Arcticibacter sp.]|jgi:hypothetical protein|uniref:hypothetical protein n=1 Tax=Arcticibacter sp. TaxID=1872630 RepID=UPI00388DD5D8
MTLSFLIAFYNRRSDVNRYLLIATVFGLSLEIAVGIVADLDRGNTYNTAYFASASVIAIVIGRYLGVKLREAGKLVWN